MSIVTKKEFNKLKGKYMCLKKELEQLQILIEECCEDDDPPVVTPVQFLEYLHSGNNALPNLGANPVITHFFVDFDKLGQDFDVTNWTPTGLAPGAMVRFRKIDNSPFKIIFKDSIATSTTLSIEYNFVDKRSEFITLWWDGTKFYI